ncbi:MAG: methionyl-tRNA formyltransferase [Chloroflexia bacterium]|nr:methionyl-tRNA formyltransferase [Chloroflexia bacterium]
MRVVFFGSPDFAVPALQALHADPVFEVVLVVTQAARGVSPVELAATSLGLPIYKPETLRNPTSREPLIATMADLFVVAAFGLIFRPSTLAIPRLGSINVHPSLLPRYRGASPILAAIHEGDQETGVSLMVMDVGIDTGAVVSTSKVTVASDDTTASLGERLARMGAEQAVRDIPRWIDGELVARSQKNSGASLTRPLMKSDGWIDWQRSAIEIERHIRAMWPWPRAWTTVDEALIQVHEAQVVADEPAGTPHGTVIAHQKRLLIATGRGVLELLTVEPAGRRTMPARAYLNGRRAPMLQLGTSGAPPSQPPLVVDVSAPANE